MRKARNEITNETKSNSRRVRFAKVGVGSVAASGLFLTLIGTQSDIMTNTTESIRAVTHTRDANEERIHQALKISTLPGSSWIDCIETVNQADDQDGVKIHGRVTIIGSGALPLPYKVLPIMRINQSVCDKVIEYADSPNKSRPEASQVNAVTTVAHESVHIGRAEVDEAVTECIAFQEIPAVAMALGASAEQALDAQKVQIATYDAMPDAYKTANCYDNGPYDTDPAQFGIFPEFAPSIGAG